MIEKLKKSTVCIIALDSKADQSFWGSTANQPKAYILGNEGHGISPDILDLVDKTVSIPINPDCESLNVAVAAGIVLALENMKHV